MAKYEIRFSKERQKRGLPCYAVMEEIDIGELWVGRSAHHTEQEAEAALAELKAKDGK